jgi:hypothetical protein
MFKLPYIILGLFLFLIGMAMPSGFFSLGLVLIGCFILSRIMALDHGVPALFIIGIVIFGLCFFMLAPLLQEIGLDRGTSNIARLMTTLASGVFTWLSVAK